MIHYLDDFLFFIPPSMGPDTALRSHILGILNHLSVPVAIHKIEGPATTITFSAF